MRYRRHLGCLGAAVVVEALIRGVAKNARLDQRGGRAFTQTAQASCTQLVARHCHPVEELVQGTLSGRPIKSVSWLFELVASQKS